MELIETLCRVALENDAEDLYLKQDSSPRLRIKGELLEIEDTVFTEDDMDRFFDSCGYDELISGEVDLAWENATGQKFRVNIYDSLGARCALLRPLRAVTQSIMALGLPVERMHRWLSQDRGLVLFTGADGVGKSTSVASCLSWVSRNFKKHIITVEDPVEYLLDDGESLVTQRQVGTDTGSFGEGVRVALRQSPDVIFVGEMNDYETAKLVLRACEAGHLVISTLPSLNVVEALHRMVMLFPLEELELALHTLSRQLLGVVGQKLVRGEDGSSHLLVEHLENEGVVREWIEASEIDKIYDLLVQGSSGADVAFIHSVLLAFKAGQISEDTARSSCDHAADFDRMVSGS